MPIKRIIQLMHFYGLLMLIQRFETIHNSYIVQIPFDKMKFNFENEQNGIEKENIENQFE